MVGAIVAGVVVAAGLAAAGWWVRQRKMRPKKGAAPLFLSKGVRTEPLPEPKTLPAPQSKETIRVNADRI